MNTKIIAIAAVVILAGGIVGAVVLSNSNNSDDDSAISIVDGAGKTIKLDKPLQNVCVINSNITKGMKMLGISDNIKCYHYSKTLGIKAESDSGAKLGTYYTPSVETLLSYDVDAVLCPVSSMTLVAGTAKTCEENGIKVIRLDCYGESTLEDVKKLTKLFGEPEAAVKSMERFEKEYNDTLEAIKNALGSKDKMNYLYTFGAFGEEGSIINEKSGLSEILAPYFTKNVTEYTNLGSSVSGVSNKVNDGSTEELQKVQDKIDCFAIRLDLNIVKSDKPYDPVTKDAIPSFNGYVGDGKIVTGTSPAATNGKIYVINTDLVSGLYAHIGILILVSQAYGIEVEGYTDLSKVIDDFQTWTTLDMIENGEYTYLQFNGDGSHVDYKFVDA